jgi:hypothetical protein
MKTQLTGYYDGKQLATYAAPIEVITALLCANGGTELRCWEDLYDRTVVMMSVPQYGIVMVQEVRS